MGVGYRSGSSPCTSIALPSLDLSNFHTQCIAGGIGLGWWIARNDSSHNAPTAIGGSANEKAVSTSTAADSTSSGTPKVTPTHTVARRADIFDVVPTEVPHIPLLSEISNKVHVVRAVPPSRHRRIAANRSSELD